MSKTQEMYFRSNPYTTDYQGNYVRALFVCSAGMLRSPTAAAVACKMGWNTRSCGTIRNALVQLTETLIVWADKIYFMDLENYETAKAQFNSDNGTTPEWISTALQTKAVVWNIPDEYNYMDATLVNQIEQLFA
jgi:predicted protein tyrosine phosphatase